MANKKQPIRTRTGLFEWEKDEVRRLHSQGTYSVRSLARKYNVERGVINRAINEQPKEVKLPKVEEVTIAPRVEAIAETPKAGTKSPQLTQHKGGKSTVAKSKKMQKVITTARVQINKEFFDETLKKRGITRNELSRQMGHTDSYISQTLRRADMPIEIAVCIANTLKVDLALLITKGKISSEIVEESKISEKLQMSAKHRPLANTELKVDELLVALNSKFKEIGEKQTILDAKVERILTLLQADKEMQEEQKALIEKILYE